MKNGFLGKNNDFKKMLKGKIEDINFFSDLKELENYYFEETLDVLFLDSQSINVDNIKFIKKMDPFLYLILCIDSFDFLDFLKFMELGIHNVVLKDDFDYKINDIISVSIKWRESIINLFEKNNQK